MQLYLSDNIDLDICTLTPDDSRHCVRVMRLRNGDTVHLTDGNGTLCRGHIVDADPQCCQVAVDERTPAYHRRPWQLHLAVAPTKNADRIEWLLEKAVEMGVDRFTPLVCAHSERERVNQGRLDRIAESAMKQSLTTYRPVIDAATPLADFFAMAATAKACKLFCHCEGERKSLADSYGKGSDAIVLIGPEGGFSPAELTDALQSGFQPVTLGDSRLRTETAALFVTAAIHHINLSA